MEQSRAITRKSASNLTLGFVLLPKPKRDAMSALYAFCREVDDVADEDTVPLAHRRAVLVEWREDIARACTSSEVPRFAVNQELQPIIRQYNLSYDFFSELLKGVEADLEIDRYSDYPQLELYCYRVASVVGLLSIEIFGYSDPRCREYAILLGKALQFTNILRDVKVDAERGRIYLPLSELDRFGVAPADILGSNYTANYAALAASFAERAKQFYREARAILPAADRKSMIAAELMGTVYWRLLRKLEEHRFNVFGPTPPRLSKSHKVALILGAWVKFAAGHGAAGYGE